jgi:hypothetical protein
MTSRLESNGHVDYVTSIVSIAVLALASLAPFLNFFVVNEGVPQIGWRMALYSSSLFGLALLGVILLRLTLRNVAVWRCALCVAVAAHFFFSYPLISRWFQSDSNNHILLGSIVAIWIGIIVAISYGTILITDRKYLRVFLIFAVLLYVWPLGHFIKASYQKEIVSPGSRLASLSGNKAIRPVDVYWIVLDGYPRGDILTDDFGFDNSSFYSALRDRGFFVLDHSRANFPITDYSVGTTLSLHFPVASDGRLVPIGDMRHLIQGDNAVVSSFKAMGYRYVHFENGQVAALNCGLEADVCLRGNESLDEVDLALLNITPVVDGFLALGFDIHDLLKGEDSGSVWGSVDDLTSKLPATDQIQRPFFLYAHIIMPHPPIRARSDCSTLVGGADLKEWNASHRSDYVNQIKCANSQTVRLLDRIEADDPTAIIILQSDHGSAFRGQFNRRLAEWNGRDIAERTSALNAMRLPADCAGNLDPSQTLINTFPAVLSCLSGVVVPHQPDRVFITQYNDSPEYRNLIDVSGDRRKLDDHDKIVTEHSAVTQSPASTR